MSTSFLKGATGKSAYQIAVENGFTGNEEAFIASLKGDKGDKGDKGNTGDTGATGSTGAKGDTGSTGAKGDKGDKGDKPAHTWSGTLLSFENPDSTQGDYVDLKGDTGDTGLKGDKPSHSWDGTILSFENPDGSYDEGVDLKGPEAEIGNILVPTINNDGSAPNYTVFNLNDGDARLNLTGDNISFQGIKLSTALYQIVGKIENEIYRGIATFQPSETITALDITTDSDGNSFEMSRVRIKIKSKGCPNATTGQPIRFQINGISATNTYSVNGSNNFHASVANANGCFGAWNEIGIECIDNSIVGYWRGASRYGTDSANPSTSAISTTIFTAENAGFDAIRRINFTAFLNGLAANSIIIVEGTPK